jgi:hypothetical protein
MTGLTEADAASAFAKAWNRLSPDGFLELLAVDARYSSQWVLTDLVGQVAIADYLHGKMKTVRAHGINNPEARVRAEIACTAGDGLHRPCVLMSQGHSPDDRAVVFFEVSAHAIQRCDLCVPGLFRFQRSGVYPI